MEGMELEYEALFIKIAGGLASDGSDLVVGPFEWTGRAAVVVQGQEFTAITLERVDHRVYYGNATGPSGWHNPKHQLLSWQVTIFSVPTRGNFVVALLDFQNRLFNMLPFVTDFEEVNARLLRCFQFCDINSDVLVLALDGSSNRLDCDELFAS